MDNTRQDQGRDATRNGKRYWLDEKRNVEKIFWGLGLVCAVLGLADLFIHRHTVFSFEEVPAFFGIFGFVICMGLVLGAKELRKVLKRDEDYYDR